MRPAVLFTALLATGCRFDAGGVTGDDVVPPDAAPGGDGPSAPDGAAPDAAGPDLDGDGVTDDVDNCVAIANPGQYNEDGDAPGDACDNCPHVVNDDQVSGDGDAVGDACDPYPGVGGDVIALFDGFHGATRAAGWTASVGADTWTVGGDVLHQTDTTREEKILAFPSVTGTLVSIDVAFTPTDVPASTGDEDNVRSVGVVTGFSNSGVAAGRVALVADLIRSVSSPAYAMDNALGPTAETNSDGDFAYLAAALGTIRYELSTWAQPTEHSTTVIPAGGASATATDAATPVVGAAALRTRNVAADFEYIVVYASD
jgi:hypothetical protein